MKETNPLTLSPPMTKITITIDWKTYTTSAQEFQIRKWFDLLEENLEQEYDEYVQRIERKNKYKSLNEQNSYLWFDTWKKVYHPEKETNCTKESDSWSPTPWEMIEVSQNGENWEKPSKPELYAWVEKETLYELIRKLNELSKELEPLPDFDYTWIEYPNWQPISRYASESMMWVQIEAITKYLKTERVNLISKK
jgi:NTP pyrophosphatase (non-canonical NTP hydrolase)